MSYDELKPPLGCRPRWIVAEHRATELAAALSRYRDTGQPLPEEWVQELVELELWLRARRDVIDQ